VIVNGPGQAHGGERFLSHYHRAGELAPRDVVARAIWREMARRGQACVWLDATHFDADYLRRRFPTITMVCRHYGLDITKTAIPVSPAAHFFMGGIATDPDGASTLDGLYAAGEVACSGVHGANRLASNSLLEGLVFGWRAARAAIRQRRRAQPTPAAARRPIRDAIEQLRGAGPPRSSESGGEAVAAARAQLQTLMWQRVGVIRTGSSLAEAVTALDRLRQHETGPFADRDALELRNLLELAGLVTAAAAQRCGSVGAHFRSDYPGKGRRWRDHLRFQRAAAGRPPAPAERAG
jgi:L-aspartate oxidase